MASIVLSTLLATGLFLWFGGSLFAFVLIYQIETLTLVGLGQAARSLAAPGAPLPATVRVVAPAF
ncbi:MAG: hypothetical protein J0L75_17195, partial [Spirochaetes bacterium]|nr:hypothetical protein [Spirochaetota bacterium]